MSEGRRRYRRRAGRPVVAIRMDLELDGGGLGYRKWGDRQTAQRGDWLVENEGDVYTVAGDVFQRTYRRVAVGQYVKVADVWAERASEDGSVETFEGRTHYMKGDYLVSNDREGRDVWAVSEETFESLYQVASEDESP